MSTFLGIDPGAKGYLCLLDTSDKSIEFVSTTELPHLIYKWVMDKNIPNPITAVGIEDVHAIFGTSAGSNFSFGFNVGVIRGIIAATGIGLNLVAPKAWQKAVGVPTTKATRGSKSVKELVSEAALRLYPHASLYGPKGGLQDGKADSLMIAHYLSLKYGGYV